MQEEVSEKIKDVVKNDIWVSIKEFLNWGFQIGDGVRVKALLHGRGLPSAGGGIVGPDRLPVVNQDHAPGLRHRPVGIGVPAIDRSRVSVTIVTLT